MLVPIKWLKDYVKVDKTAEEYGDIMTMAGITLETVRHFGDEIENVVVGKIEKIEQHPNADKLVVCQINIGKDAPIQVVTGANNIYEGAIVPVALDNSRVPGPLHGKAKEEGGTVIKSGELRGVKSEGMLCGPQELGWDDKVAPYISKDGIWLLPEGDYTFGQGIVEALGMETDVVDLDVTPNRPDWLSMLGVARESKAFLKEEFKAPNTELKCEGEGNAADYISVEIKNKNCRRYTARIITDVVIKQSPWWLQERLMYAGMRPINNIVDITNFVMLEYGQPLHAFDIETVEDRKIIVDAAKDGDVFVTLDGKERTLFDDVLMINDGKKPIAIAGIMGGLNSEIEETTKTVILEAANFEEGNNYISSKKLGLRTEASARYTRGVAPDLCSEAADRFCYLVELTGSGKVVPGSVDVYPEKEVPVTCEVRVSRMNRVIGVTITKEQMIEYLEALDMKVELTENDDVLLVTPPVTRRDMKKEVDYTEEIARMYGYNNIPYTLPEDNMSAVVSRSWQIRDLVREVMTAMGANEIQTYSFVSPRGVDNLGIPEGAWERKFVKLLNPLGEETSAMRTILTPNMMEVLARNISRNNAEATAFEIGNIFVPDLTGESEFPTEALSMCIGMYGKGKDFFTLKGMIDVLLEEVGIVGAEYKAESENPTYHPGRCARIILDGEEIGIMGEIHPEVGQKYGVSERIYSCELMFEKLIDRVNIEKHYKPLPKFPSTSRDIALVVEEAVQVGDIEKVIKNNAGGLIESVKLFDVYRGKQVEENKKSVAFNLVYRAADKTLTDDDVQPVHSKVLEALREEFNAVLREM